MTTTVTDYIPVHQRAAELGYSCPTSIAILPDNFDTAASRNDFRQRSEAATVRTLFRTNKIPLGQLATERVPYIQNNNFEWVAPTLFISSALISQNPDAVSVALGVLANYVTDFFKGMAGSNTVRLDIVVERKGDRTCRKISYEGDVKGLVPLGDLVRQISDE